MPISFSLREMTPADSPAVAVLTTQSPDGGRISFSPQFHVPAHEVFTALHSDWIGIVATTEQAQRLVGAARVSFGECQFEGRIRPYALLSSLIVHPDYRRQGIAVALAEWRIKRAHERSGSDTLVLADIQTGNVGSTANARKWSSQISGYIVISPTTMRTKPLRSGSSITIREANENDLEAIAENLNAFYRDYNLYRLQTAERLREWLQVSPLPTPINHYVLAVDSANRLLAGVGIREEWQLMSLHVEKMPLLESMANLFLNVIPANRELRSLQAEKLWFTPGQLEAAQKLWQTIRWEWRTRGDSLLCNYDPRSPIRQMLQKPIWMPTTSISIALRSSIPMSEARLIDPIL